MSVRRALSFRLVLAVLAGLVALHVSHLVGGVSLGPLNRYADNWLYTAIEVLATGLLWARVAIVGRDRAAWGMFALYATLWSIGDLGWTLHYDHVTEAPFPNWTDAVYVSSDLFAYAGMVLLLRDRIRPFRPSLWLDGLVGGLALGAVCAAAFLGPVIGAADGDGLSEAVTLAYPVLDVLLLCIVGVAFGVSRWRPGRVWTMLALALVLSAVGDAAYSWLEATDRYTEHSWVNGMWPAAMGVLAHPATTAPTPQAAHRAPQATPARARQAASGELDAAFAAPSIFASIALGILVWSQFHDLPLLAALLAAG